MRVTVPVERQRVGYHKEGVCSDFCLTGAAGEQLSPCRPRCALNIRRFLKSRETG